MVLVLDYLFLDDSVSQVYVLSSGQVMWVSATKEAANVAKKVELLQRSVGFFQQAVGIAPADGRLHFNLGQSLGELAEISLEAEQAQQAQTHYEQGKEPPKEPLP